MITSSDIRFQWQNRGRMIVVNGYYLEEEHVAYLVGVLDEMVIPSYECYISDNRIVKIVLDCYDKEYTVVECARKLENSNSFVREYT